MNRNSSFLAALAALGLVFGLATPRALATVNVIVQPTNQVVLATSNTTFTALVSANCGETITSYTWLMSANQSGPYSTVAGATNAVLALTNIQPAAAGFYFVRVGYRVGTNAEVTLASTVVQLVVLDPPRLLSQPQSQAVAVGKTATFSVKAAGGQPLVCQWRFNGTNLLNGGRVSGATSTNLTLTGLISDDGGNYNLVVTNTYGAATSQVAVLTVLFPPTITVQPTNWTTIVGSNTSVSVTVTGTPPFSYAWLKGSTPLVEGGRFTGTTNSALAISGALTSDAGNYRVVVTNIVGVVTSAVAKLTVLVPPTITSSSVAGGRQGLAFTYRITATGTTPITFGATGLPTGLALNTTNGIISGIPAVSGVFNVTLFATNAAMTASAPLTLTLTTGVPGINSPLAVGSKQGLSFQYTITASNNPTSFSASGLPVALSFNPATGVIAGPLLVNGTFPLTITATNQYGGDLQTLTLTVTSSVPVITSSLVATGMENATGFSYTITATESPYVFGAADLPMGLTLDTNTGVIAGTPLYGGTNNVTIWARNAYGAGSNTLQLQIGFAPLAGLAIADVTYTYSAPYLLDFAFALRDSEDPATANAVVRPPDQLQVVCLEDGQPIGQETAFIVNPGAKAKQFKTFMVLDYTFSMYIAPDAIDNMQTAAKDLIAQEPVGAQFGLYEFHADYVDPQLVTGFTSDKGALTQDIDGILTNYVKGDYAGTRCWDAIYAALGQFGPTNRDEQRFLIAMTDGNDESSLLNTNAAPLDMIVALAQTNQVRIYCVAYSDNVNVAALQQLTSQTGGRYFVAASASDLVNQFNLLLKDVRSQYLLRWATLKRAAKPFQPMFTVTVDGLTASFNTNIIIQTNIVVVTNPPPAVTNITTTNLTLVPLYNPPDWAGNLFTGSLRLVADSQTNASAVTLRASYVPRYVRGLKLHYLANYPCTPVLDNTGPGEILAGWTLTSTNDGAGGQWLTLMSSNPTNLLTSLPYGIMGDLVTFKFRYQDLPSGQVAFSVFGVDNTIYSNMPPGGQSFVFENTNQFITTYPVLPYGTPVPWLIANGFTNNFAAAEVSDPTGKGMPLWQQYIAGLNPWDTNSVFVIRSFTGPPNPPQIIFSTALERTYRVESATAFGNWITVEDGIPGNGGDVTVTDYRNLNGIATLYYRVVVY